LASLTVPVISDKRVSATKLAKKLADEARTSELVAMESLLESKKGRSINLNGLWYQV